MNKRNQTILEIISMALVVVIVCAIVYGAWWLGRQVSYSFMYDDLVKQTICEMVKPEHLKNPLDCKK